MQLHADNLSRRLLNQIDADDLAAQHAADPNHLLQPQQYSSDIKRTVYGLHQISTAWRGLSVLASVLDQIGQGGLAQQDAPVAASIHDGLEAAVAQSRQTLPDGTLFTPAILLDDEIAYDQLTSTSLGGYWNLVAPYGFAAGVYAPGGPDAKATLAYIYQHGGRLLGLLRRTTRPTTPCTRSSRTASSPTTTRPTSSCSASTRSSRRA